MEGVAVTGSLHFWLRLSLCALTLRGLWSITGWIAARRSMTGAGTPVIRAAGRVINPLAVWVFWFTAGCSFMVFQFDRNSYERRDLDVAEVFPAGNARMIERDGGTTVYVSPCPQSPTRFLPGMHVKVIRYAQMDGCKLVKYFDYDMRPDGRIQLGEVANVRP
jgi:hypothetical protein